jgi:hypothetical protein
MKIKLGGIEIFVEGYDCTLVEHRCTPSAPFNIGKQSCRDNLHDFNLMKELLQSSTFGVWLHGYALAQRCVAGLQRFQELYQRNLKRAQRRVQPAYSIQIFFYKSLPSASFFVPNFHYSSG